ncbi:MAG TPA: hypothetical protein VKX46_01915, partial [Ktedonobacteraceae bacterium]|nr:hypothetical protein [Ktedonobacteraceae bacterium]
TIQWQETSITLAAHDDGLGANATQLHTLASDVMSNGPNGHHGLQGMRERAAALDGVVEAGPLESGGFRVCLRLPFAPSD